MEDPAGELGRAEAVGIKNAPSAPSNYRDRRVGPAQVLADKQGRICQTQGGVLES
jgi:hypothetical protein